MIGRTRLDPLPTTSDHPLPDTTLANLGCQDQSKQLFKAQGMTTPD